MTSSHPSELELFLYVEEELPREAHERVRVHASACEACTGALTELESARAALAGSPLLELAPRRREQIMQALPAREQRPRVSARRVLAVLAPAAALVAAVAAVQLRGDDRPARTARPQPRADAATPSKAQERSARPAPALEAAEPVRAVKGPPAEVAALLRRAGFRARVAGGRVEVRGAEPDAVTRALAGRPPGRVRIRIR